MFLLNDKANIQQFNTLLKNPIYPSIMVFKERKEKSEQLAIFRTFMFVRLLEYNFFHDKVYIYLEMFYIFLIVYQFNSKQK